MISRSFLALLIFFLALLIFFLITGCYPFVKKKITDPEKALEKVHYLWPKFTDDMDVDSLSVAIKNDLKYLNRLKNNTTFTYGPDTFTTKQVEDSLKTFLSLFQQGSDHKAFNYSLKNKFFLYKVPGRWGSEKILFTGYFEPIFQGNIERDSIYRYPIYKRPENLLTIDLGRFRTTLSGQRLTAMIDKNILIPYYTRKEILEGKVLERKNLEIAWLKDPLDVAVLQIQGSGIIRLPNGEKIRVGYSATNGHLYRSIGRYMIDRGYITAENVSLQSIRSYIQQHPESKDEILNYNPSYIFFRLLDNGPLGNIGVPLTPGRSLAVDDRLFPKGGLVYIRCQKPVVDNDGTITDWVPFSRFVLNQDTGGVIKGTRRADIFWGSDSYAELAAGHLKHTGEMYFLIKKPDT